MTASPLDIRVQDIDHCGLVAGICDEMGLVEQINRLLGSHPQEIISVGQVVKAMILNGLGFVSAPLYKFIEVFYWQSNRTPTGRRDTPRTLKRRPSRSSAGQTIL
jgi:Domain of unknown function (DUF4277)